jgi:intraflagellar transport protein 122
MCTENLVVCQDNQLLSYSFTGARVRDWVLEANVRYIRSVGGMSPNEVLLAGLKDGQVSKPEPREIASFRLIP